MTGCGSMQVSGRLRQSPRAHLQWHQACMDRAAGSHRFQGPGKSLAWARDSTKSGALGTSQHTVVQLACCKSSEQIRWCSSPACAGSDLESQAVPVSKVKKSNSNGASPPAACAPCDPLSLTTSKVPQRRVNHRIMGACKTTSGKCPALATPLIKQSQSTKHDKN